jgi:hypothetical protein
MVESEKAKSDVRATRELIAQQQAHVADLKLQLAEEEQRLLDER